MSADSTIELTQQQRDFLLRGLRYVRSSIKFDADQQPSSSDPRKRDETLREIKSLSERIESMPLVRETSEVT